MSVATCPAPRALEHTPAQGASHECIVVMEQWQEVGEHYLFPITRRPQSDAEKFQVLAEWWREGVRFTSSLTEMALHPAYQRIIGMGPAAVPFLLRELKQRPDHWFWALSAITGADPVQPEHRGRVKPMAQAWLRWAKEQGLHW